jgi:hypothetical protein
MWENDMRESQLIVLVSNLRGTLANPQTPKEEVGHIIGPNSSLLVQLKN